MTNRPLTFSLRPDGSIASLRDAELEAKRVLDHVEHHKLQRAACAIPMAVSNALATAFQQEAKRKMLMHRLGYEAAVQLTRIDYPGVFAVSTFPRTFDDASQTLCNAEMTT